VRVSSSKEMGTAGKHLKVSKGKVIKAYKEY
jgi:hypothetical protein